MKENETINLIKVYPAKLSKSSRIRLMKYFPLMIEETLLDIPWSFDISQLAKNARVPVPPLTQVAKVLAEMGYHSCKTHYSGTSLKTDANETELCSIISSFKP